MKHKQNVIYWFRRDLRLLDNPALSEAASAGPILPIFIFDGSLADYTQGSASRWWLNHSLNSLNKQLNHRLLIFNGDPKEIIPKLAKASNSKSVYWNRCYEPWQIELDSKIEPILKSENIDVITRNGSLLCSHGKHSKKMVALTRYLLPILRDGVFHCLNQESQSLNPQI